MPKALRRIFGLGWTGKAKCKNWRGTPNPIFENSKSGQNEMGVKTCYFGRFGDQSGKWRFAGAMAFVAIGYRFELVVRVTASRS
jgi:hypothetical protein